jgi:hypothetical protein
MKKTFENRLAAINWIADFVENEAQFEVLREQLNFNYIYQKEWFLEIDTQNPMAEVVWLNDWKK